MKYLIIIMISVLIIGCGSAPKHKYEKKVNLVELDLFMQGKPASYRPFFEVYLSQGARNSVLNEMRIGLRALHSGDYNLAAWLFDRAILKIETIYANNKIAKKARSKFSKEEVKDFKGDPYERAMVYFYRGLLYLLKDDYENARASMLGGLLQDSLAEDKEYEQDFSTLYYLAGWASQCNGDESQADDYYKQAEKLNSTLLRPSPKDKLMIIATSGISPIKKSKGKHKEQRYFDVGADLASYKMATPHLTTSSGDIYFQKTENLHWQATTRGGRTVDVINEGKAQFKTSTGKTGDAFVKSGNDIMNNARYSNNKSMGQVGAAFALIGLVSKGFSAASKPAADIRYWDNLPSLIYLATTNKPDLYSDFKVFSFTDKVSKAVDDQSLPFQQKLTNSISTNTSCDLIINTSKDSYLTYRHSN